MGCSLSASEKPDRLLMFDFTLSPHTHMCTQLPDELGSSPRDLLLARGGAVQRLDLVARAAALLRPTQGETGGAERGEGGGGPVVNPEACLAEAVAASKHWPLRDMRLLLAAGGINSAGASTAIGTTRLP